MNALFEAAKEICDYMAAERWEFCLIGGLAVQRWGEPRTTLDADLTVLVPWGEEDDYVSRLLGRFEPRIPDAHDFALTRRVLLVRASNGKDIDVSLGALPFETEMVARAVTVDFAPGIALPCCTAEDLFIMKAFASRPRDWLDAQGIADRQPVLDTEHILGHLAVLAELKEAPEILKRSKELLGVKP